MQRFILHANDTNRVSVLANAIAFLQRLPASKSWRVEVVQHVKRRSDAEGEK